MKVELVMRAKTWPREVEPDLWLQQRVSRWEGEYKKFFGFTFSWNWTFSKVSNYTKSNFLRSSFVFLTLLVEQVYSLLSLKLSVGLHVKIFLSSSLVLGQRGCHGQTEEDQEEGLRHPPSHEASSTLNSLQPPWRRPTLGISLSRLSSRNMDNWMGRCR